MSEDPNTIRVDVTNPGQFYACCGLMELAAMDTPDVTGWFAADGRAFLLSVSIHDVLRRLAEADVKAAPLLEGSARVRGGTADKVAPILIGGRLTIDWWLDDATGDVKTWSGGVAASISATQMHAGLRTLDLADPAVAHTIFEATVDVDAASFNFDCRGGGDAIDLGFPAGTSRKYPAVELLALIGLQRFRPGGEERRVKVFATWRDALPLNLASAVAAGVVPSLAANTYQFRLTPRDPSFRYKAFARAEAIPSFTEIRP